VFEISPTCRPPLFFHFLSDVNALRYAVFFGHPVNQRGVDANIWVDIAQFRAQLDEFLSQSPSQRMRAA
ncbi:MAG: hypothetical protein ACIALR_02945, partial [Blastopirellula sp. JB062]